MHFGLNVLSLEYTLVSDGVTSSEGVAGVDGEEGTDAEDGVDAEVGVDAVFDELCGDGASTMVEIAIVSSTDVDAPSAGWFLKHE